ncbi:MAG: hypothetical protein M3O15_15065 [Acidobacteriota bacterium]|nr:hypothetical protein [Acidobacteriota bacterium]
MTATASQTDRDLQDLAARPGDRELLTRLASQGLAILPPLADYLASDLPIELLESYEELWKAILRRTLSGEVDGPTARELAAFQKQVGLLLKYKTYAVKASSPLGYSVFLQNPAEGFSFQRHVTHKVEVFHILEVHPGGFVFLCTYEEWCAAYDPARFAAWLLGGRPDPAYDRFKFPATPGDVFVLDRLGIVHTVIGCVLEEFATISTDMVDRLHDQNAGKTIPSHFNRPFVQERLRTLRTPDASRLVSGPASDPRVSSLLPVDIPGGRKTVLADGFVAATHYRIEPHAETAALLDPTCAASLYIRSGRGRILLGTPAEMARASTPSLPVAANDLLTIPHRISYAFSNEDGEPLEVVEHKIHPGVALF